MHRSATSSVMLTLVFYVTGVAAASSISSPPDCSDATSCQVLGTAFIQKGFNVADSLTSRRKASTVQPAVDDILTGSVEDTVKPDATQALSAAMQPAQIELAQEKIQQLPIGLWCLAIVCIISVLSVLSCYAMEHNPSDDIDEPLYSRDETGKVYAYSNEQLLTWRVLFRQVPSIVMSWRVWVVVPCVLVTACFFVAMVSLQVRYAKLLETKKLGEFAGYLKVFIAFMLGLFLNNSFARWSSIVSNFRSFLTAVKQLMWSAHMMKLRQVLLDELERSCVMACYIMESEMHVDMGCKASSWHPLWDSTWKFLREEGLLTEEEEKEFRNERESLLPVDFGRYSIAIWAWIGQIISAVREEPGVLVPMYMRLVGMSHTCMAEVDQLKTCIQVQVPFTYAYLLSVIVHLNNVLLAICSGMQIGASLLNMSSDAPPNELYRSIENLLMQVLILLIQPVMYQACLVIAHVLNHPFGDHAFHLPTETFILMLRDELKVSHDSFQHHRVSKRLREMADDAEKDGPLEPGCVTGGGGEDDDDEML